MKKTTRIGTAKDTLQIIENGSYRNNLGETVSIKDETDFAVKNSKIFRTEDFLESFKLTEFETKTKFEVTSETTLEAAKRSCQEDENTNPFVLNFASAKNPGGGFLGGAQAQEESLARSSSLYPCLSANFEMYEYNRRGSSCLYSDWMIYSPKVPVFRNDDGSLIRKPYLVSFLTSPAVNAGVVREKEPENAALIEETNRERARKFLWLANRENHKTLVLGAWGCGVFRNDPQEIAGMFKDLLDGEFANCFERIVFAVYDKTTARKIYGAFAEMF